MVIPWISGLERISCSGFPSIPIPFSVKDSVAISLKSLNDGSFASKKYINGNYSTWDKYYKDIIDTFDCQKAYTETDFLYLRQIFNMLYNEILPYGDMSKRDSYYETKSILSKLPEVREALIDDLNKFFSCQLYQKQGSDKYVFYSPTAVLGRLAIEDRLVPANLFDKNPSLMMSLEVPECVKERVERIKDNWSSLSEDDRLIVCSLIAVPDYVEILNTKSFGNIKNDKYWKYYRNLMRFCLAFLV